MKEEGWDESIRARQPWKPLETLRTVLAILLLGPRVDRGWSGDQGGGEGEAAAAGGQRTWKDRMKFLSDLIKFRTEKVDPDYKCEVCGELNFDILTVGNAKVRYCSDCGHCEDAGYRYGGF